MTKKHLAIGIAVIVVLASGAALAQHSQETPTEPDDEDAEATVEFEDQSTDGETVVIDSVTLSEGGYVVIHNESLYEGDALASSIGVSEYLEPGEHENVTVELFDVPGGEFTADELTDDQTLAAMPHQDTNDDEEFDFVADEGAEDGPYVDEDGEAVLDEADVTVDGDEEDEDDDEDEDADEDEAEE